MRQRKEQVASYVHLIACFVPSLKSCVTISAARHELALGNTFVTKEGVAAPKSEVDPKVLFIQFIFDRSSD